MNDYHLALTRFSRYGPLLRLERVDEAQQVLEECLEVFRKVGDSAEEARTLGALSDVWYVRGDTDQAIALGRQALAARERLEDPNDRAVSHQNLAVCLEVAGQVEESLRHTVAALAYYLVAGRRHHFATLVEDYTAVREETAESGRGYELPQLAELMENPEFDALRHFLEETGISTAELQATINQELEGAEPPADEPAGPS